MADLCGLLDEMIRRFEQHAAQHPEAVYSILDAEQIVCEVVRDAAIESGSAAQTRLASLVLGRGIRGTP